jgi:hypothetical protein
LRHDVPYTENIARLQSEALGFMFGPAVLARISDASFESTAPGAMRLSDLFAWTHAAIFRELDGGAKAKPIDALRRTLQARYTDILVGLYQSPAAGVPEDARALARVELAGLDETTARALRSSGLDDDTRAHLAWLRARVRGALREER